MCRLRIVVLANYPRKSIDQSCDGATVPDCCHLGLSSDIDVDYEARITSSMADFKNLIGKADSTTRR